MKSNLNADPLENGSWRKEYLIWEFQRVGSHFFTFFVPQKSGFRPACRQQHKPGCKGRRAWRSVLRAYCADRGNPPLYGRQSLTGCLYRQLQSGENMRRSLLSWVLDYSLCVRKCLSGNSASVSTDVTKLGLPALILFTSYFIVFFTDQIVMKTCLFFFIPVWGLWCNIYLQTSSSLWLWLVPAGRSQWPGSQHIRVTSPVVSRPQASVRTRGQSIILIHVGYQSEIRGGLWHYKRLRLKFIPGLFQVWGQSSQIKPNAILTMALLTFLMFGWLLLIFCAVYRFCILPHSVQKH